MKQKPKKKHMKENRMSREFGRKGQINKKEKQKVNTNTQRSSGGFKKKGEINAI